MDVRGVRVLVPDSDSEGGLFEFVAEYLVGHNKSFEHRARFHIEIVSFFGAILSYYKELQ